MGTPQTRDIRPDLGPFACGSGAPLIHTNAGSLCVCVWGGCLCSVTVFWRVLFCLCTGVCFSGQDTFLSFSDTLLLQSAVSVRPCEAENLSPDPTAISDISGKARRVFTPGAVLVLKSQDLETLPHLAGLVTRVTLSGLLSLFSHMAAKWNRPRKLIVSSPKCPGKHAG